MDSHRLATKETHLQRYKKKEKLAIKPASIDECNLSKQNQNSEAEWEEERFSFGCHKNKTVSLCVGCQLIAHTPRWSTHFPRLRKRESSCSALVANHNFWSTN